MLKSLEELISGPQFQMSYADKRQQLLPQLLQRAKNCAAANPLIAKHHRQFDTLALSIDSYAALPYLPVSMFKQFDLATVPQDQVVRTLLSSATTTGTPSRIPIDKLTSKRQTQGLAAILKDVLGSRRRPFLVLDCPEINRPGHQLTARGAAVRGIMPFASEICYGLAQQGERLVPNLEALQSFFDAHAGKEVLLFGFTFMVWMDVVCELQKRGVRFEHPQMTLLHSGGWKKLSDQQVDKQRFAQGISETFGCAPEQVRDFYGMVEQVGVVFVDCAAGHKHTPAFAEVAIRDFNSLEQVEVGGHGLIQVMSLLPGSYPGHALITEDVGELLGYDDCPCGRKGLYFRFRSRVEQVEVRGCGDTQGVSRERVSVPLAKPTSVTATAAVRNIAGQPLPPDLPATESFTALRSSLAADPSLNDLPLAVIVALLHDAGQRMFTDACRGIEGVAFLAAWLQRNNLERVLETNFGSKRAALDRPAPDAGSGLLAAPRGLVGHWVAGNVPTLAVFSWALAILAKNASIVRVAVDSCAAIDTLFQAIAGASIEWQGQRLTGEQLLARTSVIHFPSEATSLNSAMSLVCDARTIWGGSEAVEAIRALPCLEHCEDLVFGAKFSLAVADRQQLANPEKGRELARKLARELAAFEQAACSSPQILYLEGAVAEHASWLEELHRALAELQQKAPRLSVSETAAANIVRLRGRYGLDPQCRVWASRGTEHSILATDGAELVDAVQARTLFVKGVAQLEDCLPLLSPKVQTIGVAIADPQLRQRFTQAAARRGVSRCVPVGTMNYFETPWDGMLPVSRLVRWVRVPFEEPGE